LLGEVREQLAELQLDDGGGFKAFIGLSDFEFDAVAFVQCFEAFALDDGEVDENILASLVLGDEAEALFIIKPFDDALSHDEP
jgi:hypothetical protein